MPTYSVQLNVNVPTVGSASPVQTGIVAASMEDAIAKAKANIVIVTLQAQQTAP